MKKLYLSVLLLLGVALSGTVRALPLSGAADSTFFPFVLPWNDAAPGTATDMSFLNTKPAGVMGHILVRGGHFTEAHTGRRVRFLGVNLAAAGVFRSHADADSIAAHMAKLGINIVRLHHMDNSWSMADTIWDYAYKDRQHINPAQLDKLDYMVAALKRNGIYVDINLHVSREFTEADGFPATVKDLPPSYDKRVDNFDRRMIALQKEYARQLLTHVNPYTHLAYAVDPCVAVVEINNENSLIGDAPMNSAHDMATLPEPFRGEIQQQWNDWLIHKYATDSGLQTAWLKGVTPVGAGLLTQTSSWTLEHQGTSLADYRTPADAATSPAAAPPIQVTVSQVDDTDWHVQAHVIGITLKEGETYTLTFQARADEARPLAVNTGLDQPDWHGVGLAATAQVGPSWKSYHYLFTAHNVVDGHNRVAFTLGSRRGTVWIRDLQITPGAADAGLQPGESLTTKTVNIPEQSLSTAPQYADWLHFMMDAERSYAEEMRAYVKDTLGVQANVIDSQLGFGGPTSFNREAKMDFADSHDYWQHPEFPHAAWDPKDWRIANSSMVASLADDGPSTFSRLSGYRMRGKPFSVSEYDHPAPADYQAEMMPLLATFAAFQDWDMFTLFDYGVYGAEEKSNDRIQSYFANGSNPAKAAFLAASALIFRAGEFAPATQETVIRDPVGQNWPFINTWDYAPLMQKRLGHSFLTSRITVDQSTPPNTASAPPSETGSVKSSSSLTLKKTPAGGQYIADSAGSAAIAGFVGGSTITLREATLTFPAFGNNFAAVTLTPVDRQPIATSRRILLTLVGKVENQGMVWNAAHNSVEDQWGHAPTMAEGIPATVSLHVAGPFSVYALDGQGKRTGAVPATYAQGHLSFTVGPQYKTLWYEIVARNGS